MTHISEIIDEILVEWAYRVHDGMPNPKNVQHIHNLRESMEELNLPNKVICEDESGVIECIFFNSYEGYIKKILPLNEKITISGKIGYFRNNYQLTNPKYVSENSSLIKQIHNK